MTDVYMSQRARHAAKTLAIRYQAFMEARHTYDASDATAYWADKLAEAQAETGVELIPTATLRRFAAIAA